VTLGANEVQSLSIFMRYAINIMHKLTINPNYTLLGSTVCTQTNDTATSHVPPLS